jgi:DNA adenine methylase
MTAPACTRPIVRYHGGKWRLAPWIIKHFPNHRCYVEPFGGGGSVLLRKPRSYAEIYNDLDGEIVNLFRMARDAGDDLRRLIELTPFSRTEFRNSYLPSGDPLEQARLTLVRSFMGFGSNAIGKNTGFRSNSTRSGTTPSHDWRNYPLAFGAIIERLQGVVIENNDATEVMRTHDSHETLHYVDPPYVSSTRNEGRDYRHEMNDAQHRALADVLKALRGTVILSGYASDLYEDLYADWHRVERRTLADGARSRTEVLWINRSAEPTLL